VTDLATPEPSKSSTPDPSVPSLVAALLLHSLHKGGINRESAAAEIEMPRSRFDQLLYEDAEPISDTEYNDITYLINTHCKMNWKDSEIKSLKHQWDKLVHQQSKNDSIGE